MNNIILIMPLILILTGLVTFILPKNIKKYILLIVAIIIPVLLVLNNSLVGSITYDWFGNGLFNLGLSLSMTKLLFGGIIWFSFLIYSIANFSSSVREEELVLFITGGMSLAVFASDFITLFIGWEIMSWASFVPLLYRGRDVKAARRYLVYSLAGAAMLLTGILIIGLQSSFAFNNLVLTRDLLIAIPFLMLGFLLKSGIMPLHHWIPTVYNEASDLLTGFFSGALSKAGIYGFILIFTIFPHNILFLMPYIGWLGAFTALFATFRAIVEPEIKKLLAWSSIAQVGYIITAFGLGTAEGIGAGLYHTIIHTVIKLLLFTIVAGVINRTGKTRFDELGGLIKQMPYSFIAVLLGIIALAGMPPLGGFASKWAIYSALLNSGKVFELIIIIAASTAAFLYNFKLIYGIFLGHPTQCNPENVKEVSKGYIVATIVPMLILVITGMYPSIIYKIINPVLSESGFAIVNQLDPKVLASTLGSYNGFIVMSVFGAAFFIILILFSLVKGKSRNAHRLDIAYAGETPLESYPLHFGYGLGREIRRIPFIGFWLKRSTSAFYKYVHTVMNGFSSFVRTIFTGDISTFFYLLIGFIILFWLYVSGGNS